MAYRLAAIKPHSPESALSGVRHFMLVFFSRLARYSARLAKVVFTDTCTVHLFSTAFRVSDSTPKKGKKGNNLILS